MNPEDQAAAERLDQAIADSNAAYGRAAAALQKQLDERNEE